MLLPQELIRYDRQILIEGLGAAGQEKLKKARVVVAGTGGLGSPISIYLTAAGVGTIRLIDYDTVDLGNLNRQVLYGSGDIGQLKVEAARRRLEAALLHRLSPLSRDFRKNKTFGDPMFANLAILVEKSRQDEVAAALSAWPSLVSQSA